MISTSSARSKSLSFIDGYTSRNSSYSFGNDYVELQTIDTDISNFPSSIDSSLTDITFTTSPDQSRTDLLPKNTNGLLVNDKIIETLPPPDPSLYDSGFSEKHLENSVDTCDSKTSCPSQTKISESIESSVESEYYTSSETSLENKENKKSEKFYKLFYDDVSTQKSELRYRAKKFYGQVQFLA